MKYRYCNILLFFLLIFLSLNSFSQTRSISGRIIVKGNAKEPVSFANIAVVGTHIGTMSDFDGKFSISVPEGSSFIEVSAIGYTNQKVDISNTKKNYYTIKLAEEAIKIDEIVIDVSINPAIIIQKKVARNRHRNDPDKVDKYAFTKYLKHQFYISEVDSAFMNNIFFRKHPEAFVKQSEKDSLFSFPISFREVITEEYKQKNPDKHRITIKGENFTGVKAFQQSQIDNYVGIIETNFYQNHLLILDKNFVSPLSSSGNAYYKYFIKDTVSENGRGYYKIKYTPRRKKELVFKGYFYVDTLDYSVSKVDAELLPTANINFIKNLNISQEYQKVNDSVSFYKQEKVVVDFVYSTNNDSTENQSIIRSVRSQLFNDVDVNPDTSKYDIKLDDPAFVQNYEKNAIKKDTSFWNSYRKESFDSTEQKSIEAIETVNKIGIVRLTDKLVDIGLNGYISTKYLDIGPWQDMIQKNKVEGNRFAFAARTSGEWTGRHGISGFIAYGSRDKLVKYGGGYVVELPSARYQLLGFCFSDNVSKIGNYKKNIRYLRENKLVPKESNIIKGLIQRKPNFKLYRLQEAELKYEIEWRPGFINRVFINNYLHHSSEFVPFTANNGADSVSRFNSQEITFNTRLSWDEKVVTKHFRRIYLSTTKPRINFNVTLGRYEMQGNEDYYLKFRTVIKHYFPVWMGKLACNYELGYILGSLPYPLLEVPQGNESYGYARFSYNLLNNLEYSLDRFACAKIEYYSYGLILNYIPLIRRMNMRENFVIKTIWGDSSPRHRDVLDYPEFMDSLDGLYTEVGVGVSNIFKLLRIQCNWRLTDLDKADVSPFITQASILIEF